MAEHYHHTQRGILMSTALLLAAVLTGLPGILVIPSIGAVALVIVRAMRPAVCVRVALLFPDCRSERYRDLLVFRARALALSRCALRYRRRPDRAQYVAERIWDQSEDQAGAFITFPDSPRSNCA